MGTEQQYDVWLYHGYDTIEGNHGEWVPYTKPLPEGVVWCPSGRSNELEYTEHTPARMRFARRRKRP